MMNANKVINLIFILRPDRSEAFLPPSLLRTVRAGFLAHGSSISKERPFGTLRLFYLFSLCKFSPECPGCQVRSVLGIPLVSPVMEI